jgi:hypothetical protein
MNARVQEKRSLTPPPRPAEPRWAHRDVIPTALRAGIQYAGFVASRPRHSRGAVSLRLPDTLEQQLRQEGRLSGQPRSQLMGEALETLLSQRRDGRAQAALRLE